MNTINITRRIQEQCESLPEGTVLSAKALLHLGSRAAVDQALSRLARSGHLLRVGRGLYSPPVRSGFGTRGPRPEKLVEGLASLTGETIAPGGASSANTLGLTTQVPVRSVYLTSGQSRQLRLGSQVLELRHAPAWQLYAPTSPAGQALRALAWLGPAHVGEAVKALRFCLPPLEQRALVSARARMPSWLAEVVSRAFCEDASAGA